MQNLSPGQRVSQRFTLVHRRALESGQSVWVASLDDGPQQVLLRFFPGLSPADLTTELRGEIQRAVSMVHPSLVRCLGLFEHDELVFLAHELGENDGRYEAPGQDYRRVVPALLPVAKALAYLHDLDLAHGGIDEQALRCRDENNVVIDSLAVAWVEASQLPSRRADIVAFGALLGRLSGAEAGTPLPESLARLLRSMQSGSQDVGDMHEVVRRLERALNIDSGDEPRPKPVQGAAAGAVAAQVRIKNGVEKLISRPQARPGIPMTVALPALLLLVAAVVYVVFFLPRPQTIKADAVADVDPPAAAARPQAAAQPDVAAPFAAAADARLRQTAQDAAMSLLRSLVALEERGVSQWAPGEFATARLGGDEGDALYREQNFSAALARYEEGLKIAESLVVRSGEVLEAAVADGNAALAAGDAELARTRFDLALAIDSEHPEALLGLDRVEKLGEVLEKMRLAEDAEREGNISVARDYYREAVALDADYLAASEALQRVRGQLGARSFQDLMSRGFRALDRDETSAARDLFEKAARLRPAAPGPKDALAQVEARLRDRDIATRRSAAEAAERAEDWGKAVSAYSSVLQTDSTLVFAREGLARAQQRALLAERMQRYIDDPLKMFENQAYNEARSALAQARSVADPGPVLRQKIADLAARVSEARTPVVVQLKSDNITRVNIYKIGEIGQFQQQSVGLIPGRYTAVGSRSGYRDVRRVFEVQSGKPPPPVTIVCEDPV